MCIKKQKGKNDQHQNYCNNNLISIYESRHVITRNKERSHGPRLFFNEKIEWKEGVLTSGHRAPDNTVSLFPAASPCFCRKCHPLCPRVSPGNEAWKSARLGRNSRCTLPSRESSTRTRAYEGSSLSRRTNTSPSRSLSAESIRGTTLPTGLTKFYSESRALEDETTFP